MYCPSCQMLLDERGACQNFSCRNFEAIVGDPPTPPKKSDRPVDPPKEEERSEP